MARRPRTGPHGDDRRTSPLDVTVEDVLVDDSCSANPATRRRTSRSGSCAERPRRARRSRRRPTGRRRRGHEVTMETSSRRRSRGHRRPRPESTARVRVDEHRLAWGVRARSPTTTRRSSPTSPWAGRCDVRGFSEDCLLERDATPGGWCHGRARTKRPAWRSRPTDHVWLVLRLETGDGQVLWRAQPAVTRWAKATAAASSSAWS